MSMFWSQNLTSLELLLEKLRSWGGTTLYKNPTIKPFLTFLKLWEFSSKFQTFSLQKDYDCVWPQFFVTSYRLAFTGWPLLVGLTLRRPLQAGLILCWPIQVGLTLRRPLQVGLILCWPLQVGLTFWQPSQANFLKIRFQRKFAIKLFSMFSG